MSFQEDKERFCAKWYPGVIDRARDERSWAVRLETRGSGWQPRLIPHLTQNAPIPMAARGRLVSDDALAADVAVVEGVDDAGTMDHAQRSAFRRLYLKGLSYADVGAALPTGSEAFLGAVEMVVVAPHCDDAALSIGGLLLARSSSNSRTRIHTLFGQSNHATGPLAGMSAAEITQVRRFEEAAYCAAVSAEFEVEALPDRLMRMPYAPLMLDGPEQLEMELASQVALLIAGRIDSLRAPVIVAPLAAGLMADHAVVAAAVALLVRHGYPESAVLIYDDLPYAARPGAVAIGLEFYQKLGLELTAISFDVTKWFESKCELLSVYASQVSPTFLDAVEGHAQAVAVAGEFSTTEPWRRAERLWRVRVAGVPAR